MHNKYLLVCMDNQSFIVYSSGGKSRKTFCMMRSSDQSHVKLPQKRCAYVAYITNIYAWEK